MMKAIIGCGNLLLRDEGIGIHLIEYLKKIDLPEDIELVDAGTAGFDLIDFIQGKDKVVIVDAVCAGGKPGEIYRFLPQDFETKPFLKTSFHDTTLKDIFGIIQKTGPLPEVIIIGIEPKDINWSTELSPELKEILPRISELVLKEVRDA